MRRYYFDYLLDSAMDDMARDWTSIGPYHVNGKFVNTDDYEIIPKPDKVKRDLKQKEQELNSLRELKKHALERYDKQIEDIEKEIQKLNKSLSP